MNIIGRILAVLTGAFVLTSIAAAIAARAMKQRIVRVITQNNDSSKTRSCLASSLNARMQADQPRAISGW